MNLLAKRWLSCNFRQDWNGLGQNHKSVLPLCARLQEMTEKILFTKHLFELNSIPVLHKEPLLSWSCGICNCSIRRKTRKKATHDTTNSSLTFQAENLFTSFRSLFSGFLHEEPFFINSRLLKCPAGFDKCILRTKKAHWSCTFQLHWKHTRQMRVNKRIVVLFWVWALRPLLPYQYVWLWTFKNDCKTPIDSRPWYFAFYDRERENRYQDSIADS